VWNASQCSLQCCLPTPPTDAQASHFMHSLQVLVGQVGRKVRDVAASPPMHTSTHAQHLCRPLPAPLPVLPNMSKAHMCCTAQQAAMPISCSRLLPQATPPSGGIPQHVPQSKVDRPAAGRSVHTTACVLFPNGCQWAAQVDQHKRNNPLPPSINTTFLHATTAASSAKLGPPHKQHNTHATPTH
jgi:hypothetical protein